MNTTRSFRFINIQDFLDYQYKSKDIMNIVARAFFILTEKCSYPFTNKTDCINFLRYAKERDVMALLMLRTTQYTNPGLYLLLENDDVMTVALLDSRRIDRLATKKGEERKGFASALLHRLSTTLHHHCSGFSGLGASVDKAVIPVFESAGWIVMNDHKVLKHYTYSTSKATDEFAMCPASELPTYTSMLEKGTTKKMPTPMYNNMKRGWDYLMSHQEVLKIECSDTSLIDNNKEIMNVLRDILPHFMGQMMGK